MVSCIYGHELERCNPRNYAETPVPEKDCPICNTCKLPVVCPNGHAFDYVNSWELLERFGVRFSGDLERVKVKTSDCSGCRVREASEQAIRYLYRPDQRTRVIVHGVRFLVDGEPYMASFHGCVVDIQIADGTVYITVELDERGAVEMSRVTAMDGGNLTVGENVCAVVTYKQLTLGKTCRERCEPNCRKHRLGKLIKL